MKIAIHLSSPEVLSTLQCSDMEQHLIKIFIKKSLIDDCFSSTKLTCIWDVTRRRFDCTRLRNSLQRNTKYIARQPLPPDRRSFHRRSRLSSAKVFNDVCKTSAVDGPGGRQPLRAWPWASPKTVTCNWQHERSAAAAAQNGTTKPPRGVDRRRPFVCCWRQIVVRRLHCRSAFDPWIVWLPDINTRQRCR